MFIKKITIKNFRLFPAEGFEIDDINTPDGINEGSGLNVFVGENGSGKTALLDAFALPILEYKTKDFGIDNFNNTEEKIEVNIYSKHEFEVRGIMPKSVFTAKGFSFNAGVRSREARNYLSSAVVNDQYFIKVNPAKPADNSPDLRVNVNNPFSGKRFSENDVLFLDKNRLHQTRSGNFNTTRFDRLMEDFGYQYLKNTEDNITNLNDDLDEKIKKGKVENDFLRKAIEKFKDISDSQVKLDFLNNYEPFKNAFFATKKGNNQQIYLSNLGSGYEMIFALLYSLYLAQQSDKQLIILIDEPELHLHPKLQEKFVKILLEFSKNAQILLSSHSPLLVKQVLKNDRVRIMALGKEGHRVLKIEERVLPYVSANEINFFAFDLVTEEYHNELYGHLQAKSKKMKIVDFEDYLKNNNNIQDMKEYQREDENEKIITTTITLCTYIRNQIHHPENTHNTRYNNEDLKKSVCLLIEVMRSNFPITKHQ